AATSESEVTESDESGPPPAIESSEVGESEGSGEAALAASEVPGPHASSGQSAGREATEPVADGANEAAGAEGPTHAGLGVSESGAGALVGDQGPTAPTNGEVGPEVPAILVGEGPPNSAAPGPGPGTPERETDGEPSLAPDEPTPYLTPE